MKVCLMGIGNVLMGDDALGPWVLESLQAGWELPADVKVMDAGTHGLDLTLFIDGFDALVAVDALNVKGVPGEVRTYRREQLLAAGLPIVISPHEPSLREALTRLELLGRCPREVLLVGAIPERVETGTGLSAALKAAIPDLEVHVLRELARLGHRAVPRAQRLSPRIWWESA